MSVKRKLLVVLLASAVMLAIGGGTSYATTLAEKPDPSEGAGPTKPAGVTVEGTAVQTPLIAALIDIKVDDVNNYNPAVAYNDRHDEYLVVWENDRGATRDIYAQRVAGDGTLKSWFIVSSTANKWTYLPDVAYNPLQDEYLIVYTYLASVGDDDIWARRVRWDGSDLNQSQYQEFPVNIENGIQWYPAVTYNGTSNEYLVVYENNWSATLRNIGAQRVRAGDGQLLGPTSGYSIASAPNTIRRLPDVAYNPARNEYLIAYTYQYSATDGDIYGKTVSFNPMTLSSEIQIISDAANQDAVTLAAGPDEYLAVWSNSLNPSGTAIYGRRVTGAGALQPYIILTAYSGQTHVEPAVAYGNIYGYLVTWRYASGGAPDDEIYGRFVKSGQNTPWGSTFGIYSATYSQRSPALACGTRGDCLVVEEDNRPLGADYEIRGRFVQAYHVYLPCMLRNH